MHAAGPTPTLTPTPRHLRGFTLIETLVVLVISVGLVALMTLLFRSVGHAAVALRGGNPEWAVQAQLREQLVHGFTLPGRPWLIGSERELTFLTWKGRREGFDGRPVIAQYRYDAEQQVLRYREAALPPWWGDTAFPTLPQLATALEAAEAVRLVGAIDGVALAFVAKDAPGLEAAHWRPAWTEGEAPRLVVFRFSRGRDYTLWFETAAVDAT